MISLVAEKKIEKYWGCQVLSLNKNILDFFIVFDVILF